MERAIAASSQRLTQGGMIIRDWFSDKLGRQGTRCTVCVCVCVCVHLILMFQEGCKRQSLRGNRSR